MFESLSEKLKNTLKNLRGQGKLKPEHVDAALREIRMALLEADVNYKVAKEFVETVRNKAEGQEIWQGLNAHEQVVKIVYDELVELIGGTSSRLVFTKQIPNVVMIVGLQGSGKTTSTGKIARWLKDNQQRNPLLVSVDVYRPAARKQLGVVAEQVGVAVYENPETDDPTTLVDGALKRAVELGYDTLLVDTAGRLHIDDELMAELEAIKQQTRPIEVLFVADAMTGQDAVRSAEEFNRRVGITGVVLTKMDGDARGGAALSIRQVTGKPVKFVGTGEKLDAIEPFYPERIVQRILGMGDVLTLIEEVQAKIDEEQAQKQLAKLTRNQFTLEDFREQLRQFKKLGSMSKLMKMLPEQFTGGITLDEEKSAELDRGLKKTEAIIDSMTRAERQDHRIIDASRKTRIAHGSGTTIADVNQLLRQYEQMRKMMAQLGRGGLFAGLGRKMMGGLAGGLGGLFGGGPMGSMGMPMPGLSDGEAQGQLQGRLSKKKKRHKKRK
ncbi:MAG TPA: signal recognition particle protein [Pyrinomonadaceae bacterium]|nr:signal recognition particle protein [Pyrinomonadaceae bacterium]